MADQRMLVRIDPDQVADIKAFLRKEADRSRDLTPELAQLALSLDGWTEVTSPGELPTRSFIPGVDASEDHPAAREAKLRRRIERLGRDMGGMDPAGTVSVAWVRGELEDILR
jgi:hypothetical protein